MEYGQHCEATALTKSGHSALSKYSGSVQEKLKLDGSWLRRVNEMDRGEKNLKAERFMSLKMQCDSCQWGH